MPATGLGNHLFLYVLGRLFAENLGYSLKAMPRKGFPNTYNIIKGKEYLASAGYPSFVIKDHNVNVENVISDKTARHIIIYSLGCRNCSENFLPFKEDITRWLAIDGLKKYDDENVVIHVRRGDYVAASMRRLDGGYVLPFLYYKELLKRISYRKAIVVTDDPSDPFIRRLEDDLGVEIKESTGVGPGGWNPHTTQPSHNVVDDFRTIAGHSKIIMSPSTFSWWAAFLSDAKEIYYPLCRHGYYSPYRKDIDFRVNEKRYIYVDEQKLISNTA